MTLPRIARGSVTACAAVALAATALGCGVISRVKQAADNITTVGELAKKLGNSDKLTFTAEYKLSDGSTATVVQQPPDAAYLGKDGRFIVTADSLYLCGTTDGKVSCQKSENTTGQLDAGDAGLIPGVAGAGFVSAPVAVAVLTAASLAPGATVAKTTRKIAGQDSTCVKVSGIKTDASPGTADVKDFTACVTDGGLLASFAGTLTDGTNASIELTRYSGSADVAAFAPPAGAQIVDVETLQPSPSSS